MNKKTISVVIPIYNEVDNIALLYKKLKAVFASLIACYDYEIIMINDGSSDDSWKLMKQCAENDSHLKIISFSRNFGHQIALTAGYDYAIGDAIISMDADLQHPPEFIPRMIKEWEQGFYVVYIRNVRKINNFFKTYSACLHYKILDAISYIKIPRHVQDFRLIDKKVLHVLKESKEKARYLRGIVAWTGFRYTCIDAEFDIRKAGKSGYSLRKMIGLSLDGITSFSLFPLKIASYAGCFVVVSGIAMFVYITFDALLNHVYYPLFKWLVTIIYIFLGILFILLWFIGEYIGRIYEEIKGRPLYIIQDRCNISENPKTESSA